jgi:hypothetical protein
MEGEPDPTDQTKTNIYKYLSFLRFPSIDKKIVRGKFTQKQIGGISTGITV